MPERTAQGKRQEARGDGVAEEYSQADVPLAAYTGLSATFVVSFAGSLLAARAAGRELPESLGPWDVVMTGAATQKLSRLITKAKVTSFIRAPFVEFEDKTGFGEVSERPRGRGLRRAVGELLGCPFCLGQWLAGGFGVGMVAAPRTTRLVAFVLAAQSVADFLQLAYGAAEEGRRAQ